MRYLIINTDYPAFLSWFYGQHKDLDDCSYLTQLDLHAKTLFGVSGTYSKYLKKLNHHTTEIHANNPMFQSTWCKENDVNIKIQDRWEITYKKSVIPWITESNNWLQTVLAKQIESIKPDVIVNFDLNLMPAGFFSDIKAHYGILIGQHAATPLNEDRHWREYDLMLSSFMPTVDWFLSKSVPCKYFRLGFDVDSINLLGEIKKDIPLSFIGSFSNIQSSRLEFLEDVAREVDIQIWGPYNENLNNYPNILKFWKGEAWGKKMFEIIARSKITLNHHGEILPYANNLRLYESTGLGTLLLTDNLPGLSDKFEIGKEVLAYSNSDECINYINSYLKDHKGRELISLNGQRRTKTSHNYSNIIQELTEIVSNQL